MQRTERLIQGAVLRADQAILVHKPSNVFYLSGYTGEGLLVVAQGLRGIVTDFRYTEQAQRQAPGWQVFCIDNAFNHVQLAAKALLPLGVQQVLYEDDEVTVKAFAALREAFGHTQFASLALQVEKLRMRKDPGEVALLEKACDISCRAFEWILGQIRPGMSEKEIQLALDYHMLSLGAQATAFSSIVASGPNGSLPHAIAGDRRVQPGDMITLDFGAKFGGYCADMTRTIALGQPQAQMKTIYDTVLRAQTTCQEMLAPGRDCREIDQAARDIIGSAGYGAYFGHGLGHSVGIDIHEEPRLSPKASAALEEDMLITVEPGIYVPGLGGVRIENTCIITPAGARSLIGVSRELIIL